MMPKWSENLPMSMLTTKRVGVKGINFHIFCSDLITMATASEKKRNNSMRESVPI